MATRRKPAAPKDSATDGETRETVRETTREAESERASGAARFGFVLPQTSDDEPEDS